MTIIHYHFIVVISIRVADTCSMVYLLNLLAQLNAIYDLSATIEKKKVQRARLK